MVDDIHLLDTTELKENFANMFSRLMSRRDVWLILISRAAIPGWLKSLYIKHIFVVITEQDLSLSPKEQEAFFEKWQVYPLQETLQKIPKNGKGYPLFLRIFAMHLRSMDRQEKGKNRQQAVEAGNFLAEREKPEKVYYEFRRDFRQSMQQKLKKEYTKTHMEGLYYNAGACYELQGNVPDALAMYEKAGNEEGISRLLVANARKYAGNGHYWELRRYYRNLPEDLIRTSPELMCGMSLLQSILLNDEESERWYTLLSEYAKEQSGSARRAAQARLLYLDIALPHRGTVKMVDLLKNAGAFLSEKKNILPEFSLASQGRIQAESGGKQEQVFVSVGILSQLAILNNHAEHAFEMLESFRQNAEKDAPQLLKGIDTLKTRYLLYVGKSADVVQWLEQAPDEDIEFCTLERYRYMEKIRVYLSVGKKEKALSLAHRMLAYAEKRQRTYIRMGAFVLLAITEFRMGKENWKKTLQNASSRLPAIRHIFGKRQEV